MLLDTKNKQFLFQPLFIDICIDFVIVLISILMLMYFDRFYHFRFLNKIYCLIFNLIKNRKYFRMSINF